VSVPAAIPVTPELLIVNDVDVPVLTKDSMFIPVPAVAITEVTTLLDPSYNEPADTLPVDDNECVFGTYLNTGSAYTYELPELVDMNGIKKLLPETVPVEVIILVFVLPPPPPPPPPADAAQ
jgi:hypothetical protein